MPANGRSRAMLRLTALSASLALACVLAAASAPQADAGYFWKVKGAGFGHGAGMGQWGTYGFAKKGKGYRFILRHYYTGTKVGTVSQQKVRVLLRPYQRVIRFRSAETACGKRVAPSRTYSAVRSGNSVVLRNPKGKRIRNCGRVLKAFGGKSVFLAGRGHYRGTLVARLSSIGGRLNAINNVKLDDYVRGVVARESPSSWPLQALQAQAVAARSYALTGKVGGNGFDLYDDTRSQVYAGRRAETKRTNIAVARTAREVVRYKGKIATTFFFSTSGGRTEHNENVFGGSPLPYLRSVKDPYDGYSPLHRWTKKFSRSGMQSRLGGYVKGKLTGIKVLKRGASPRILRANIIGTGGKTKVSGSTLLVRLGLYDTWAHFIKKRTG